MKKIILKNKKALTGMGAALLIGGFALSFEESPFLHQKFEMEQPIEDTFPGKNYDGTIKMKDYERLTEELNKALLTVDAEIKKIDVAQIQKEIEKAIQEIDINKIIDAVSLELKSIDLEKILSDVKRSVKDIDRDKINGEIKNAMNEAKKEIVKASRELSEIDNTVIEKALEKAKNDLEKTKLEMKKIDMDRVIEKAKKSISKAKEEIIQNRSMLNEMEANGLINPKEGFSIEYKDKNLYINGKKQTVLITDRYRKYFKEDHFSLKTDKE